MELPNFVRFFLRCPPAVALLFGIALALPHNACANSQAASATFISLGELQQQTVKFLTGHYQHLGRLEVSVGNLDRRLRPPSCNQPLVFTPRDTSGSGGNINVQVACAAPTWSLHLPAQVAIFRDIPVAARDIGRGEQLTAQDIQWQQTNISLLRQGYLLEPAEIIGLEVKRNLGLGSPFISASLDAPTLIKRGDIVELEANYGGIRVIANGTAMADGRLGQKIRVKNNQSDRIVTGTVIASGKISTL